MARERGNWFNNSNIKGYLFFLLLTTIVAIFIKLANTYQGSVEFQVEIRDVPDDLVVTPLEGNTIVVNYESSGFSLVRNSFRESVINISFDLLKENEEGVYLVPSDVRNSHIEKVLGVTPKVIQTIPEQLLFNVDVLASKEVPVAVVKDIDFAAGYGGSGTIRVEPEVAKIIGSLSEIDSIKQLFTKALALEEVSSNLSQTVSLDVSTLASGVKVVPSEVRVTQKVEKFTEGSVVVPVTLINEGNRNIQLFPKEVTLFYTVPISQFDTIKESDFVVRATASNDGGNESYLPLEVVKKADAVSETRLSLNQVQYVIVNE